MITIDLEINGNRLFEVAKWKALHSAERLPAYLIDKAAATPHAMQASRDQPCCLSSAQRGGSHNTAPAVEVEN